GAGAERFARQRGLKIISTSYFHRNKASKYGTVGAVALDRAGNLAAATSTGGITGKLPGRVGDSPIVGAGVYADNAACAVSGTGDGELFLRAVLAFNVAARIRPAAVRAALPFGGMVRRRNEEHQFARRRAQVARSTRRQRGPGPDAGDDGALFQSMRDADRRAAAALCAASHARQHQLPPLRSRRPQELLPQG